MHILDFKKIILFLFWILIINNCSKITESPKKVVSKFLEAKLNWDYKEAYNYISSEDKQVRNLEEYKSEIGFYELSEDTIFIKTFKDVISFKIKKEDITKDKAVFEVEIQSPDFSSMTSEFLGEAFISAFSGKSEEEITKDFAQKIREKYKDKEMPMTTTTTYYNLMKEKDGWKVFLNWKISEKVEELMEQAKAFEKEKDYQKALEKYIEITKIDSKSVEAVNAEARKLELEEKIKDYEKEQEYIKNIIIRNVHIGESFLGETGVFGEIKNNGNKTLKKVEITIYCLDKSGNPVFEKDYHPVLVSDYIGISDANEPLKPNYSRKFGVKMDDAPSDWARKVRVEITDIEFEE